MIQSPLTGSANVASVETIDTKDIRKLYRKLGFQNVEELRNVRQVGLYRCLDTDLLFFHPQITGSESFYERLQRFDWYYLNDKSEYRYANEFVADGAAVLDVGCGKGQFGRSIQARASFVGLEFNDEAITKGRKDGLDIRKESIQQHALAHENAYDVVTAFQVLEHISDINGFIAACLKATKPGGKVIFSVPSYDSLVSLQLNNTLNLPPHHVTWWTDRCLKNLGSLYKMKVEAVHHEELDKEHKGWFAFLLASEALKNLLLFKTKRIAVDTSLRLRLIYGLAGLVKPLYGRGITDRRMTPHGQSVTAVYTKTL